MTMQEQLEVPEEWTYGIGERSDSYYDYWLYHESGRLEGHQYWDEGGKHYVEFLEVVDFDENDDPIYSYPSHTASFESEEDAEEYLLETAEKLR